MIIQFLVNLIAADSFSKMNSYATALQILIYCFMLLDLNFMQQTMTSFEKYVQIAQLDYIPETGIEYIYKKMFKLVFGSELTMQDEHFQKLGHESSNFLLMTGSITIFIFSYFLIAVFNEVFIGFLGFHIQNYFANKRPYHSI